MADTRDTQAAANRFGVVVIAASAGGIFALEAVLGRLPAGLPVPVLLVQHLDPRHETHLPEVLSRSTALTVKLAEAGERPRPAVVYIAPPDRHLLIGAGGALVLDETERVRFVRPSADRLFESAARAYGAGTLACVLTGTGTDGSGGAEAVTRSGGVVMVQDPGTAKFGGMPQAAADACPDALVLPLERIGATMCDLLGVPHP